MHHQHVEDRRYRNERSDLLVKLRSKTLLGSYCTVSVFNLVFDHTPTNSGR